MKIFSEDKAKQWLFQIAKEKQTKRYHKDDIVKIESENSYERCMHAK